MTSGRRARSDESSTPLTRRQLREQQALEASARAESAGSLEPAKPSIAAGDSRRARRAAQAAPAQESPTPAAAVAPTAPVVPVVTSEIVVVPAAEAIPLTRRQLREQEQQQRERELALRAEELADLEIAELGSAPLEPAVELVLDPVEPEPAHPLLDSAAPALHLSRAEPVVPRASVPALAAPAAATTTSGATPTAREGRARRRRSVEGGARRSRSRGGWAKAGVTAVAMSFVLGITAVTAIPSTVSASPVDANVVNLSLNAGTAPAPQQLVTASGSATEVVNRDGYAVTDAGELQAAGYSTAQLLVGRSLAQELVNAVDSGKLVGSTPDHIKEIRWIAQGVTVPDCGVDYRVLEIIAIAVRNFDQVGVSDINRKCTGQIEGAGTSSSHYTDGGGHAVDFYLLDNKSLNGTDAGTLKLISLLDPVMPVGAHVGQAQCRASAGIKLQLTNWTEFDDSCTHMHVDVPSTDAPLLLTDDSVLGGQ